MTLTDWLIAIASCAMMFLSMAGLAAFLLWRTGQLQCPRCRWELKKRLDAAMANPKPRSDMLPIFQWSDNVARSLVGSKKKNSSPDIMGLPQGALDGEITVSKLCN
jgi:hypothetical protein